MTHYDVVIVGSGAGGGTVAQALAPLAVAGKRVLVLEKGPRFRDEDFTGRELDMARELYEDGGAFLTADGSMTLAFGLGYGGSTIVYTGTSLIAPERVMAARYVLCTMLDEAAADTPWGGAGVWGRHSLLAEFHNEAFGGEKAFQLMARLAEKADANLDLLELIYGALTRGFASPRITAQKCSICRASGSARTISATPVRNGFHQDRSSLRAYVLSRIVGTASEPSVPAIT